MFKRLLTKISTGERWLLFLYSIVLLSLSLYSFTQVDLSLALARVQWLQDIVFSFQQIGYFNRPLSTTFYLLILFALTGFYIFFLMRAAKQRISRVFVWATIGIAALILTFSYNAFSYDIFNYIFDAKIVTGYGDNPYEQKALDYPEDPMLSFMRWTHREYPYGPIWLGITIPLSFIGMQIFLVTFFLFKILAAAAYVGSVYFISRIMREIASEKEILAIVFFALNPLILIESLVSAHIDIVMIFFALWSLWLLVSKKYMKSYLLFFVSVGIKFVTAFLLPIYLIIQRSQRLQKTKHVRKFLFLGLLLLVTAVIFETRQSGNFQPWYLIVPLAFAAFVADKYYVLIPSVIISLFAMFTYVPFLYTGNWDPPIPQGLADMYFFSYSFSFFIVALYFFYRQVMFARSVKKK